MTLWHKRALWSAGIWVVATAGFLIAGLSGEGPGSLVEDSTPRDVAAAFVGAGLLANLLVTYLTRRRKDSPVPQVDERDEHIQKLSLQIALIVTTIGVFLFCIALSDNFQEAGSVPVNWLWFVAWCTLVASNLGQALAAVVLYAGVFERAQG